ncbi:hypothetical protein M426DRAFT_17234 [Hypoxylon sp. CI-4A]|nr:hypothetical protein M426DRAFT_17234 [Hypoxylon sp. CI-4A]
MAASLEEVKSVLSLIESMKLPHPSGPLLECFVSSALNPIQAARYVKHRLSLGEASSLVDDWSYIIDSISESGTPPPQPSIDVQHAIAKRDGGKCCVTGKAGTLFDPLIVAPILLVPSGWNTDKPDIIEMLGAFFGPPYRDWWLSYARNPEDMMSYFNHWLVRKSAVRAFALGLVRLDRLHPSMVEYEFQHVPIGLEEPIEVDGIYPLLGDHSRSGISKIDPRFFSLESLHQSPNPSGDLPARHSSRKTWALSSLCAGAVLALWRLVPTKVRIIFYKGLQNLGRRLYGHSHTGVQRVPFGLYLKYSEVNESRNEFNALGMVRRHTSIPVPKAIDIAREQEDKNDLSFFHDAYLVTTRIPGFPLSDCQQILSDRDLERIATQLKDYVAQLREIPRLVETDMAICNTFGEECRDHRIQGATPIGPFPDEAAFSQQLRFSDDPARRGHKIVFTHADLNPRNILVDRTVQPDGRISWNVTGIIDWEGAGFYPEYWDYTKAMFEGFRWPKRYNDMMHTVFSEFGDYSREFDVEKRS